MAELEQWLIEARGQVQKVGYRDRVRQAAKHLNLVGWTGNDPTDEDRVIVIAQGRATRLLTLIELISGPSGLSDATEVRLMEKVQPDPSLKGFIIKRDPDTMKEMLERLEEATRLAGATWETMKETLAVHREILAVRKEILLISKETLAVGKETLGVWKETLSGPR